MSVELFPLPSQKPLTRTCPQVLPGASAASAEALRKVVIHNHENHHIFFNDQGFHNHTIHHTFAIWALGAPGPTIEEAYKENRGILRDVVPSPGEITEENFNSHLGDKKYYNAYMNFFKKVITGRGGISGLIEDYILSPKANVASSGDDPEMLNRFLSGLVHPIIHASYGLEFEVPGILAEGLAMTAVHRKDVTLFTRPLYDSASAATGLASRFQGALGLGSSASSKNVHAFTILSRILADERLIGQKVEEEIMLSNVIDKQGSLITEYAEKWALNTSDPLEVEKKIEELQWMVTLMYAGPKQEHEPLADFFLMHLVTSSIFLPTVVENLTPESKNRLLRGYFHTCLAWYIARGRPQLDIPTLFSRDLPKPPTFVAEPRYSVTPGLQSDSDVWMSIIKTTIVHPDDHLCKIQRALIHYANLYGNRKAGEEDFTSTELKDADKLDGSLFLRAAVITNQRMTRGKDDGKAPFWDFHEGFFN